MKKPTISKRGLALLWSTLRKHYPIFLQLKDVFNFSWLNVGNPDSDPHPAISARFPGFKKDFYDYPPSPGYPYLLESLHIFFQKMGFPFTQENINIAMSGMGGMRAALMGATDHGDRVLILSPGYPPLKNIFIQLGLIADGIPLSPRNDYSVPDYDYLKSLIRKRTKAIIINPIHNPTGRVLRRDELQRLWMLAQEFGLWVIIDDPYFKLNYRGYDMISIFDVVGRRPYVVYLLPMSKLFSTPGFRLCSVATLHEGMRDVCLKMAQTDISAPNPGQLAWGDALRDPNIDAYLGNLSQLYEERSRFVQGRFSEIFQQEMRTHEGCMYFWATVDEMRDSEAFVLETLRNPDIHVNFRKTWLSAGRDFHYAVNGRLEPTIGMNEFRTALVVGLDELALDCDVIQKSWHELKGKV